MSLNFAGAIDAAKRHKLPSYDEWLRQKEAQYDLMPRWYGEERTRKEAYAKAIEAMVAWKGCL